MKGVAEEIAREALRLAGHKLPCVTKFIKRETEVVTTTETSPVETNEIEVEGGAV